MSVMEVVRLVMDGIVKLKGVLFGEIFRTIDDYSNSASRS